MICHFIIVPLLIIIIEPVYNISINDILELLDRYINRLLLVQKIIVIKKIPNPVIFLSSILNVLFIPLGPFCWLQLGFGAQLEPVKIDL